MMHDLPSSDSAHSVDRHCSRCDSPLETGDLRCPICGAAAPRHTAADDRAELATTLLRCHGCGAAITYDPDLRAPACSFCGDVLEVQTITDPVEQTQLYLPMTVTRDQARATLKSWLGTRGWFTPSDLSAASQLTEIKPLWWVAWIFDAEAHVSWSADSNANSGRSAWAPHAGQNPMRFDNILVSGSRGLTAAETNAITPGMQLTTAADAPHGGGEHPLLERFDIPRSQARQQVGSVIESSAAQQIQQNYIPGTRFRNVHVSIVLRRLITKRYSLPAYVLAYRYRNQLHRVVICGQNTQYIIGTSPFSYAKLFVVIVAIGAAFVFMLLIMAMLNR